MEGLHKLNRLSEEKSPYLRQHATNPVEWHPWNEETLALAKKMDRPIFLSIGYSTCHWCHVMAHESFENEKIAALMNRHFLNIKVDREERPDVDAIYMTAVQALTGSGGWPMSMWLTPDLKPFYAGTYFPPEDRYGRPGFPSVLNQLAEMWEQDRSKIVASADQITDMLRQYSTENPKAAPVELSPLDLAERTFKSLQVQFDSKNGGFGPAPKFPMPVYMEFLLDYFQRTKTQEALDMVAFTMRKISCGGIYDQLGGGFSRYSTDDQWIVPHFEKMLYDNAQLISVVVRLAELTGEQEWKDLVAHAVGYILRDLRHQGGAFYSAEDADSEGKEGTFYLWTLHQVREHLSPEEAEVFIAHRGVTLNGNFMDPHHQEVGKNVLIKVGPAGDLGLLRSAEKKLLEVRNRRPRPHRDEKILTEWNGLMISALSKSGQIDAAGEAANFIQKNMVDLKDKQLFRSWCEGMRSIPALQSDYALLIQGLLDLFEVSQQTKWKDWAVELQDIQDRLFFDDELGGYFMNVARPDLLIRMKDEIDNVIPSGNSVAVSNGLRLAVLTKRIDFKDKAMKTLQGFSIRLQSRPVSMVSMVQGYAAYGMEL